MIYLKQIFNGRTAPVLAACLALLFVIMQTEASKIAYKKSIQGKTNGIKEKQLKTKISDESKHTTTTTAKATTVAPLAPPPPPTTTTTTATTTSATKSAKEATLIATTTNAATTTMHDELEVAETTIAIKTELSTKDKSTEVIANEQQSSDLQAADSNKQILNATNSSMEFQEVALPIENIDENQLDQQQPSKKLENVPLDWVGSQEISVIEEPLNFEENSTIPGIVVGSVETTIIATTILTPMLSSASTTTSTTDIPTTASKRPVPCTCGVFMTSQIKRTGNPYEPPIGRPVIMNELDRIFPCNAVGQKQCQTKCLETIVQHLPNSANILCASLDHDVRKERAYLFIKNCRNQWFNTNLAAGREYCCKNSQPYQCPLV